MRTTLTIDDDLASRLSSEVRRSGKPFKVVVNETLRLGLNARAPKGSKRSFAWRETPLAVGVPFESTSELIERLDGVTSR